MPLTYLLLFRSWFLAILSRPRVHLSISSVLVQEVAEGSDQKQVQLDKFQQMSVSKANGEATLKQLLHDARDAAAALKVW